MGKRMKNKESLSNFELNNLVVNCPILENEDKHFAKDWKRVDVGDLEVYVGDRKYVVAFVEEIPKTAEEMKTNTLSTEETIMRYLIGEGFVDEEDFLYVGLQLMDINDIPEDFGEEDGGL
jgi:hypothetical protein